MRYYGPEEAAEYLQRVSGYRLDPKRLRSRFGPEASEHELDVYAKSLPAPKVYEKSGRVVAPVFEYEDDPKYALME